jgi:hypothetical protein
MKQIDIEILRYKKNLARAVERKLPRAVIQQYSKYIIRKMEEKQQIEALPH